MRHLLPRFNGPPHRPADIIDVLNREINEAVTDAVTKARIAEDGLFGAQPRL